MEKLLRKGYEILYLVEAVDEYALSSLPEFEGKKFQNVAKEGLAISANKEKIEELNKEYEPLTKWLTEVALKDMVRIEAAWHKCEKTRRDVNLHVMYVCVCR